MAAATDFEFDLVAACCLWPASQRSSARIAAALTRPINWERFLTLVHRHRIFGLANAALSGNPAVPAKIKQTIAKLAQNNAQTALRMTMEMIALDRRFHEAGVPVAFVKGAVLGQMIHGTVGLRHSRDLDLLVPVEALPEAQRILAERGYRRTTPPETLPCHFDVSWVRAYKDFEYRNPRSGIQVELHWRLFDNHHLLREVPQACWRSVPIGSGAAPRNLGAADQLLYLCVHGAVSAWFRMKWLADIDTILTHDPDMLRSLIASASQQNLLRPVAQALLLCQALFGTELPNDVERTFRKDPVVRYLVATANALMRTGENIANFESIPFFTTRIIITRFLLKTGWRYRLAEIAHAFDSLEDWLEVPLPPRLAFLYPWLRLPRWGLRKAGHIWKTMRRDHAPL